MLFLPRKKRSVSLKRAFTLVELLITIAIIVLATGAVLTRQDGFNETTLLKSQALEIALDIRAAQQFGVNVRAGSGSTRGAYGIYFDPESLPGTYILFLDADGDLMYDSGEEVGDQDFLDPRFEIHRICVATGSGSFNCSQTRKGSVAFERPNFDAVIRNTNAAGIASTYTDHGRTVMQVQVVLADDTSISRDVVIYSTGQISVE